MNCTNFNVIQLIKYYSMKKELSKVKEIENYSGFSSEKVS